MKVSPIARPIDSPEMLKSESAPRVVCIDVVSPLNHETTVPILSPIMPMAAPTGESFSSRGCNDAVTGAMAAENPRQTPPKKPFKGSQYLYISAPAVAIPATASPIGFDMTAIPSALTPAMAAGMARDATPIMVTRAPFIRAVMDRQPPPTVERVAESPMERVRAIAKPAAIL